MNYIVLDIQLKLRDNDNNENTISNIITGDEYISTHFNDSSVNSDISRFTKSNINFLIRNSEKQIKSIKFFLRKNRSRIARE
jgi:hypothetical protein